ncbi:MAG: zinc ribbon domain-containing protein [Anaerolineae bacterium]|nr:zinc ribbon domain-containing protein [Anaerolineae bacterium]
MPLYTYECAVCGVRFDQRQRFSDAPLTECPECGGHVHRVPQPVGIVFKGSGWYAKDSKGASALATPPKRENGTSETKSEAKPDVPSAPTPSGSGTDKSD